jgi:hypothetical protein
VIGEHELALIVRTPQGVGLIGSGKACALGLEVTPAPAAADQTMAVQDSMHGADGGQAHAQSQALDPLADLRSTPAGVLPTKLNDQRLHPLGHAVSLSVGSPGAICQALKAQVLVALVELMARLARDVELAAQRRHLLPLEQSGDETQPLIHLLTLLPGHVRLPQMPESVSDVPGMIPMCPKAQTHVENLGQVRLRVHAPDFLRLSVWSVSEIDPRARRARNIRPSHRVN